MNAKPLSSLYGHGKAVYSVEFFPPKKISGLEKTKETISHFKSLPVDFMTVTYGAGGTTQGLTIELLSFIHKELKKKAVSHLTCVGQTVEEIDSVLNGLWDLGIRDVLALRGDSPVGESNPKRAFSCARDLISHINATTDFSIFAAGYPEVHKDAASPKADIEYLKQKVDCGASAILTQLFFDADIYFRFIDDCQKNNINVPIIPGIMPVRDYSQLERFTSLCGATIPLKLRSDLESIKNNSEEVISYGTRHATALCRQLLDGGAPGIHFYSLNHSHQVEDILSDPEIQKLTLTSSTSFASGQLHQQPSA
jgi:methylenetetrahydrofolate reductase (NADPH)